MEGIRARVAAIERRDDLRYQVRCRWKDKEELGRPGPDALDLDDGLKGNIRSFQEAELLAVQEFIKK